MPKNKRPGNVEPAWKRMARALRRDGFDDEQVLQRLWERGHDVTPADLKALGDLSPVQKKRIRKQVDYDRSRRKHGEQLGRRAAADGSKRGGVR